MLDRSQNETTPEAHTNIQLVNDVPLTKSQMKVAGHLRLLSSISGEPVQVLAVKLKAGLPVIAALSAEERTAA